MDIMADLDAAAHVQVRFFTKQEKYSVPDVPFSIPTSVGKQDLGDLVNGVLVENVPDGNTTAKAIDFDFLIDGEFLRTSLGEFLDYKSISTENVIDVEYFEKQSPPAPETSLRHDDWVSAVDACSDWILTGCYDSTLHIWSTQGKHMLTIPGHSGPVKGVTWLTTDTSMCTFASTSQDQTAMIWEWNPKTNAVDCVHVCQGHERSVDCVATNEDATQIATGSWDKTLKIWSAAIEDDDEDSDSETKAKRKRVDDGSNGKSRKPLLTFPGHHEAISSVRWMDDHEVCTASWDHTMRIWDLKMGGIKSQLIGAKNFLCVDYSQVNHHLISASADRHVRLWDPKMKDGSIVKSVFTSHTGWVTGVSWSKTNEHLFISTSYDKLTKLWDLRSPQAPLYDMKGHTDNILCCNWSNPEYILTGGADNCLKIFTYH